MPWKNENLPQIAFDRPAKWLLLPGVIIQWLYYMFPARGKAALTARQARSPLMTYYYSAIFYIAIVVVFGVSFSK